MAVQIDAAINSGNSGGPVLNDAFQVVGIAFQSLDAAEAESVGYFIPNVVVEHFLDDIARNAAYTGFPCPGFSWQATENASLRASLSLPDDAGGVLVQRVDALGEAAGVLRKGDIVTHLDGYAVSRAGTVPFTLGERICFTYRVTGKFVGDRVRVRVLRDRAEKEVVYALPRMGEARLVPVHDSRRQPEYLIIGGLVFQSLSEPFLDSVYGASFLFDAPVHLIELYNHAQKKDDGVEEIVVLAQILSADVNEGYDDAGGVTVLSRCNGERVLSLRHLAEIIDKRGGKFLRFEHGQDEVIVLDRRAAEREAGDILDTHCIPHERSVGLMKKR